VRRQQCRARRCPRAACWRPARLRRGRAARGVLCAEQRAAGRSGGGARLRAGRGLAAALEDGRGGGHGVLPALRAQRDRRAQVHAAADVPGAPRPSCCPATHAAPARACRTGRRRAPSWGGSSLAPALHQAPLSTTEPDTGGRAAPRSRAGERHPMALTACAHAEPHAPGPCCGPDRRRARACPGRADRGGASHPCPQRPPQGRRARARRCHARALLL